MAQWREHNPSNKPGTCLWCGHKLRWKKHSADLLDSAQITRAAKGEKVAMVNAYDKPGDYGDGFFCGLRCGYMFGESMAFFGRRLNPRATKP